MYVQALHVVMADEWCDTQRVQHLEASHTTCCLPLVRIQTLNRATAESGRPHLTSVKRVDFGRGRAWAGWRAELKQLLWRQILP